MDDASIIRGLNDYQQRNRAEKQFYQQFEYFIREGCRKFHITHEDGFSAYSDAVVSAISNIISGRFDSQFSLKTYLFQIFHNKCVDTIRKISNNKQQVHRSAVTPELLAHLPETVKTVVEKLIDQEKISKVTACLEVIDERCEEILLLSVEGYSDKEIAAALLRKYIEIENANRSYSSEELVTV